MADKEFFYYRGFPLVRSGDELYYGSMGDKVVTRLTIRGKEKFQDVELPTKVMVQLVPTGTEPVDLTQVKKGEMNSLYEALDTAYVWLTKALF